MKIAYIGNTTRSYAEDGNVTMPSMAKTALAKVTGSNIFSDDITTFTGKSFEDGRTSRDYSDVIKAAIESNDEEEFIIVCEAYDFVPDNPFNDPGTYYNAMETYNTSKQDYENARPWAATAEFLDRGIIHNTNWNEGEKLAATLLDKKNVHVYIHMSGEQGLFDATKAITALGKVNPNLKLVGQPILEVASKFSKGIAGERINAYSDFGVLALALDTDVFRCNGCGKFVRKHTESLVKPWEGKECTVVEPYDNTVVSICPECGKELTQADIDYGMDFVEKLVEKQLADKKENLEREANKSIRVKRGEARMHIAPMPQFDLDEEKTEEAPVVVVDPSTITLQQEYKPVIK